MTPKQKEAIERAEKKLAEQKSQAIEQAEGRLTIEQNPLLAGVRKAEFASRGAVDSLLESIGNIPDAVAWGLRKLNIPTSPEGAYKDALKKGVNYASKITTTPIQPFLSNMGPNQPITSGERVALSAGRGVGDAASFMLPGGVLSKMGKGGGVTSNVGKAMTAQPVTQLAAGATFGGVSEATKSPTAGLGSAFAVPIVSALAKKAITPIPRQLSPQEAKLAQTAQNIGVKLTPGQITGSTPLQTTESQLAQLPFSAKPQQAIYDAQRLSFNRAVLEKAGINADNAAPEVIEQGFLTLGREFDNLAKGTNLNVDRQFVEDINKVIVEAGRRLSPEVKGSFNSYIEDIVKMIKAAGISVDKNTGNIATIKTPTQTIRIDGESYAKIGTQLREAMRASRGDHFSLNAYNGLVKSFDNLMKRSTSESNWARWNKARNQYRNLLIIDDAMKGNASDIISGNIPFGSLKQSVVRSDPRGWSRGRGDLNELARVGQFLAPRIPDSRTAGRNFITNLLTLGSVGGGTGAFLANPLLTLPAATAPFAVPRLTQQFINSPAGRKWLTNQRINQSPEQISKINQMIGKTYIAQDGGRN